MTKTPSDPIIPVNPASEEPSAISETVFEGGFKRVTSPPAPLALARLRGLVLDVATGAPDGIREALAGFESWRWLATLCGTEWAAGARRSSAAARRVLERRLRSLGAAPVAVAAAAELPVGSAVHLRGVIRAATPAADPEGGPKSHIWFHGTTFTDNVRGTVESGHDFFLTCDVGFAKATARVIVAHGHLINAELLSDGDRVSVFGFTDRIAGPGAARRDPLDRGAVALAVRAGDDLPLLVRRLGPRPTQEG